MIIYSRWHLQFIRSEFRGQLPKPYSDAANGTKIIPTHMNDMNNEEPSRYVSTLKLAIKPWEFCPFSPCLCCFGVKQNLTNVFEQHVPVPSFLPPFLPACLPSSLPSFILDCFSPFLFVFKLAVWLVILGGLPNLLIIFQRTRNTAVLPSLFGSGKRVKS